MSDDLHDPDLHDRAPDPLHLTLAEWRAIHDVFSARPAVDWSMYDRAKDRLLMHAAAQVRAARREGAA